MPSIWWAGGVTSPQKLFCFIFPFSGVPPTARCAGDVPGSGQAGHPGAVHRPSMAREVLRPLPVGLRAGAGGGGGGGEVVVLRVPCGAKKESRNKGGMASKRPSNSRGWHVFSRDSTQTDDSIGLARWEVSS